MVSRAILAFLVVLLSPATFVFAAEQSPELVPRFSAESGRWDPFTCPKRESTVALSDYCFFQLENKTAITISNGQNDGIAALWWGTTTRRMLSYQLTGKRIPGPLLYWSGQLASGQEIEVASLTLDALLDSSKMQGGRMVETFAFFKLGRTFVYVSASGVVVEEQIKKILSGLHLTPK